MSENFTPATSLGHMPGDKWEFDQSVTDVFPDMLERSIPSYHVMRKLSFDLGQQFVQPHTDIVDLGASQGQAIDPFIRKFGAHNRYTAVEVSEPMRTVLENTYGNYGNLVRILDTDLRKDYPAVDASLTLCVLTLIFIPINYRQRILRNIYKSTRPGGALILVEKTIGDSGITDELMVSAYHQMKHDNGYSWEEINTKAASMEGVQVPVTKRWNEDSLRSAGFDYVENFYTHLNFAGWLAIKGE